MKIVNDEGEMVPFGEDGEIWIRGFSRMLGYKNVDSSLEPYTDDGYLKTG